jgi:hypothetical protein
MAHQATYPNLQSELDIDFAAEDHPCLDIGTHPDLLTNASVVPNLARRLLTQAVVLRVSILG